ncbi:hypothetical protein GCM10007913_21170 [Devosia yakushimensis]|uniref:diguanylate cyclase n=1 Tax=Devosia yakushimensis TaxID=470028 RepID=A0ABQ5UDM1_9HYPH|nr:tetratricopeptide repeat-containing diguanylate cyclase [Devosia yakushimensis]GLQ10185.1 hypothetical protein GCM10007913_21170 [Devosia yakushimensis]
MPESVTITDAFNQATRLLRSGDCAGALAAFRDIYTGAEANNDTPVMAACLCEMAWSCFKLGQGEEGLECATGAHWLWERLDNRLEHARAMAIEALLLLDVGLSDAAFELAMEAFALAEAVADPAVLAFTLNAKGIILSLCREAELGAALLERAVQLAQNDDNLTAEAYYLLNLGFCHLKRAEEFQDMGDYADADQRRDLALVITDRAIGAAEHAGDDWTLRCALGNAAETLALRGQVNRAIAYLERSATIPTDPGPSLRIHYLYSLGDVLFRAGKLPEARAACTQAYDLAEASSQIDHQVNTAQKLAEILEAMGDTSAALDLQKRFHALYVRQSGEGARRLARVEEIRSETDRLRTRAAALADQALSDPLTGIANRRSFDQILNRLAGTPFALAIVDLDHFKSINDRHSHLVGDAVLQRVARELVAQLGRHGHAARLGGEEFALIFPDASDLTAAAFCEGARTAIASTDWSDLGADLVVTVSIGLAAGTGIEPAAELMQLADTRLYAAKSAGRDRVVSASPALLSSETAGDIRRRA